MKAKTMYILTYDHGGYVLWGSKLETQLGSAIEWLEKYPDFKTGLDFEAFTFDELERVAPHINRIISDTLKKYPDRFGLGSSTYGQPLSLYISEESNARQLSYAVRTNLRHFGCTPTVYAISEFALNNQSPQLLRLCGYDAAIFRTHVMNYGYQKTFDKPWGLWIGRDGSGIPAVPTYEKEGRGYFNTTLDNWILTRWPGEAEQSLEEFEELFKDHEPLLASRYDDLTLRKEELVAHTQNRKNWKFIRLEEIPEIFGEPKEELLTTDNDFHGRMPWGYCGNEIFNGLRAAETKVVLAERANALSVMLGGKSEQETLEDAWKNVLVGQHHDITICGLLDDARRFIPASLESSGKVLDSSLESLSPRFASPESDSLLVFNSGSFPVCQWVETDAKGNASAFAGGKELKSELCGDRLRILTDIGAFTSQRITLKKSSASLPAAQFSYDASSGVLSTPAYRFVLNENGIVSIADAVTGSLIVDNREGKLFCGWIEGEDRSSKGTWDVTVFARSALAVHTGTIGSVPFRFEMRVSEGSGRIDCRAGFDIHGEHIGQTGLTQGLPSDLTVNGFVHENKLRLVLDLCLEKDRRMVRDLPYSISDWDGSVLTTEDFWYKDRMVLVDSVPSPEEAFDKTTYLQGIYWIALRDAHRGLAVFNRGCMGSAVEGCRLSVPLIYSNDYIWNPRILDGTFENEFALFPFAPDMSDADLHKEALAYEYPLVTRTLAPGNGDLDLIAAASLEQQSGSVILTALYPEDGALFARFCNFSDCAETAVFSPATGKVTAETDLLGKELCPVCGGKLEFHPWEIKTLRIDL